MGRNRKESGYPTAVLEEEREEAEEQTEVGDEEEGEEQTEEGSGGEDQAEAEAEPPAQEAVEPPKLAEGFYEIEAIRRRRLRKGQLQYLVKWRGWPESANTWEPLENLKACSDIVDAFNKRSRSPRSSRKRKRKTATTPTSDPNPSRGKRGRPPRSEARSMQGIHASEVKKLPCRTSSRRANNNSNTTSPGDLDASVSLLGQRVVQEGSSGVVSVGFLSQGAPLSVSLTDQRDVQHPANGSLKVDNSIRATPSQGGQVTGAKKRKSGCVRRFKQDEVTQEHGDIRDCTNDKPGNETVDSTEGETGDKNKGEDSGNQIHMPNKIIKIIKPVRYFATVLDGVQQVAITFKALRIEDNCKEKFASNLGFDIVACLLSYLKALRSDGEEVFVDDKQLKAKEPLVLINYYEQHLRYNPTS